MKSSATKMQRHKFTAAEAAASRRRFPKMWESMDLGNHGKALDGLIRDLYCNDTPKRDIRIAKATARRLAAGLRFAADFCDGFARRVR